MAELSEKAEAILKEVRHDLSLQICIKKTGKAAEEYRDAVNELISGGYLRVVSETETEMTLSMV